MNRLRRFGLTASLIVLSAACGNGMTSSDNGTPPSSSTPNAPGDPNAPGGDPNAPGGPAAPGQPGGPSGPMEPPPVPYQHFDINHVLSTGQSNSVANGATPPLTSAQPFANVKFDTGVIPGRQCDGSGCKGYAKPTAFVPLVEGDSFFNYGVETMSSGLANEAAKLAKEKLLVGKPTPTHDVLVSLQGRSGNTYFCLRKGGCDFKGTPQGYIPPFSDAMMEVADAMAIAKAAGKSYVVRAATAIHGESDHYSYSTNQQEFPMPATSGQGTIANYFEGMVEWQKDYEAGVKAVTGQTLPVPFFMLQMSNWNDVPHSQIPTWQLEAHVKAPGKVIVVTPGYPIGYADDCLHFTNHGERRIGEYFGKAYARVVIEGKPWEPLRPIDVKVQGNVVTARFVVPKPPLVLDTTHVKDPGNYGFEFFDDSAAPPAITKVELAGADTVKITLAAAPTGANGRLRYAYTATPQTCPGFEQGPRGNLRDSDDTPSHYGYDLWNWSVHFDEAAK
ncbi:MAG: Endo,4-beta-xylanase precursor [Labilithrix sp.]|nr:Endo,4-beta-xylanase precursor [Labilithrix sp.]